MKKIIISFILLILTNISLANELEDREAIKSQVNTLFNNGKYKELDKLELKYRKNKSRTKSGLWKLDLFYMGFKLNKDPRLSQNSFRKVSEWIDENPNSVAAHIVYAMFYKDYAWQARGTGSVNNTNQVFLRVFEQNLRNASNYLDEHKKQSSVSPEWYVQKIYSMTGLPNSEEQFAQVLNEGLTKFPDYSNLYFSATRYLAPRWHGSKSSIDTLADQSIEKTDGTEIYARIYWFSDSFQFRTAPFSKERWKKIKSGMDDILNQYPVQWNIQNMAFLACKAKDAKTTIKLMKKIEKPIILDELKVPANYNYCNSLF